MSLWLMLHVCINVITNCTNENFQRLYGIMYSQRAHYTNQNQPGHGFQARQALAKRLELRSLALTTAQDTFDNESNELVFLSVLGFLIWHTHSVITPSCIHQHCKANTECIASPCRLHTWIDVASDVMLRDMFSPRLLSCEQMAGQAWHVP